MRMRCSRTIAVAALVVCAPRSARRALLINGAGATFLPHLFRSGSTSITSRPASRSTTSRSAAAAASARSSKARSTSAPPTVR